jgi:hypothetical protein
MFNFKKRKGSTLLQSLSSGNESTEAGIATDCDEFSDLPSGTVKSSFYLEAVKGKHGAYRKRVYWIVTAGDTSRRLDNRPELEKWVAEFRTGHLHSAVTPVKQTKKPRQFELTSGQQQCLDNTLAGKSFVGFLDMFRGVVPVSFRENIGWFALPCFTKYH